MLILSLLTQQQFARECDINYIVKQNEATGFISHVNRGVPQWGDFGDSVDYKSALDYISDAKDAFMSLDASLRARFDNDPGKLLDFVSNPDNADEMVKLGLANPKSSEPVSVPNSTPAPTKQKNPVKIQPEPAED